ncbi:MAG: RHS repeat-associated core domain-containing protein, partial [Planctomycetaceae bacterium]|nr:RHS repeat-associated core domain-containing protein [Planctomycetaceae bacterium]
MTYAYDYRNHRYQTNTVVSGTTVMNDIYIYDGDQILTDVRTKLTLNAQQQVTNTTLQFGRLYLYGPAPDQLLAQELISLSASSGVPSQVIWTATDHQQTVRDLVTTSGQVLTTVVGGAVTAAHLTYDSFGVPSPTTVAISTLLNERFLYTSREYDPVTGLQYNWNRWYDPRAKRWISEDPIGLSAGPNTSMYVANSPATYRDTTGLWPTDEQLSGERELRDQRRFGNSRQPDAILVPDANG